MTRGKKSRVWYERAMRKRVAQGIAARSDETPQAVQPEGQEPGSEGMRPKEVR